MPFLFDEFEPKNHEQIFFHKEIYERLKKMSDDNSIPHIIFHGPQGGGKKTMVNIFLKMIYGDTIEKLYTKSYNIAGSGNKTKKETVQNSDHHIIINPTGTNFDRYLVHEIVKSYAETETFELTQNPNSKFKTIQISNLDKLSHSAQTSLRRMIEVNARICRFIMWCDNLSNVIDPLKSRCVCIRVPRPTEEELFSYLTYVAMKKNKEFAIKHVKLNDIADIIKKSQCNSKTSLGYLQSYIFGYDYHTNFDFAIENLTNIILECDIKKIEETRDIFFNIWITYYDGITIIRHVLNKILDNDKLNDECKSNIIIRTSEIEYNMLRGRRGIIHFDAFVVSVMKLIQDYNNKNIKKYTKQYSNC